jgi:hypothetical protein
VRRFEHLLAVRAFDGPAQFGRELALLVDALQDRRAAVFELAQVQQTLLERAQLRVVEIAGDFLAIPGDERDSRAFVEKPHGGGDLARLHGEFGGNALYDLECYGFRHVSALSAARRQDSHRVRSLARARRRGRMTVQRARFGPGCWSGAFCHKWRSAPARGDRIWTSHKPFRT